MKARSALFTLFGDVIRPNGGEAWLQSITDSMAALGFSPTATRTALHRMAAEGWVVPRREGRYAAYRLTGKGAERLEEAAARIYRLRAAGWDKRWRTLVCPSARRVPAAVRELRWVGFGQLSGDVWISPHDHEAHVSALLATHDLDDAFTFVTAAGGDDDDARIVATAWDLSQLRDAHARFIDRWDDAEVPARPEDAFRARIQCVHHWRSFLFLDPGLPEPLLPADWLGEHAAKVFGAVYDALHDPSTRFCSRLAEQGARS